MSAPRAALALVLTLAGQAAVAQSSVTLEDFGIEEETAPASPRGAGRCDPETETCPAPPREDDTFSLDDVVNLGIIVDREAETAAERFVDLPYLDLDDLFPEEAGGALRSGSSPRLRDLSRMLAQDGLARYNFALTGPGGGAGLSFDQAVALTRAVQEMSGLPEDRFLALPPGMVLENALSMKVGEGIVVVFVPR